MCDFSRFYGFLLFLESRSPKPLVEVLLIILCSSMARTWMFEWLTVNDPSFSSSLSNVKDKMIKRYPELRILRHNIKKEEWSSLKHRNLVKDSKKRQTVFLRVNQSLLQISGPPRDYQGTIKIDWFPMPLIISETRTDEKQNKKSERVWCVLEQKDELIPKQINSDVHRRSVVPENEESVRNVRLPI